MAAGIVKILEVTPYAPARDGIANYAVQEVSVLRREPGCEVEVLSPLPSAAHHHHDVCRPAGMRKLLAMSSRYDRVIVQLYPALITARCRGSIERAINWGLLAAVGARTSLELRIHEIDYDVDAMGKAEAKAIGAALRSASRITVHTETERNDLVRVFGVSETSVDIIEHGRDFVSRSSLTRAEARQELGLDDDEKVFLSIGFLQYHKGFDRAISAFGRAGLTRASLHVVGSVRVEVPELLEHADQLTRLAAAIPGANVHRRYVGDVEFDRWLTAADVVVLPYREIWSSSVVERAKLYDVDLIASRVGGLADQAGPRATLVDTDDELVEAFRSLAGPDHIDAAPSASGWVIDESHLDAARIEALVRQRAAAAGREPVGSLARSIGEITEARPARSVSARPGASRAKQLVQRLVHWQLEPLFTHSNRLQRATEAAVGQLEARLDALESREGQR